jgi:hypothetical protein
MMAVQSLKALIFCVLLPWVDLVEFCCLYHLFVIFMILCEPLFFVSESKHDIKIKPLFITIDPQRDSPAQLKAYLSGKLLSVC